jgi:hypothetical protein
MTTRACTEVFALAQEYADTLGAQAAAAALQGRQFAGRSVQASYLDEAKFAAKDFS